MNAKDGQVSPFDSGNVSENPPIMSVIIIIDEKKIGSHEEWLEGYRYFCRQKVNTKGKKVDRRQLKDYNYNNSKSK